MTAKKIFLSYAHQDASLVKKLTKHFSSLERGGSIDIWGAHDINVGTERERKIAQRLNTADIILLMVSPDFLDSDYCYSIEMQRAIERHERGEARVIPIILRPVYYQRAPFARLQSLPTTGQPISSWRNQHEASFDVAEGIRKVVEELTQAGKGQQPITQHPTAPPVPQRPIHPPRRVQWIIPLTALGVIVLSVGAIFRFNQPMHPDWTTLATFVQIVATLWGIGFGGRALFIDVIPRILRQRPIRISPLVIINIVGAILFVVVPFIVVRAFTPSFPPPIIKPPISMSTPTSTQSLPLTVFSNDPQHTRFNSGERSLSSKNVASLKLYWSKQLGAGIYTIPAVAGNSVYVEAIDHYLYALDTITGNIEWKAYTGIMPTNPGSPVQSSPVVTQDMVYVGSEDGYLYAFTAQQGSLVWKQLVGDYLFSSPVVAGGIVYIGSHNKKVSAFNAITGVPIWTFHTAQNIYSSPAVANGMVYIGSEDGNVYALDAQDGHSVWMAPSHGHVDSSPAVGNGAVYVGSDNGNVYALDATTGKERWHFQTGKYIFSSPAIANGVVYIGSHDLNVYALDAVTGKMLWKTPAIGDSSPFVANGVVYVGSDNGTSSQSIYALDALTGKVLWSYPTKQVVGSAVAEANGILSVGSQDGTVYAFHLG